MIRNSQKWITVAYGETLDEAGDKAVLQIFSFLTEHTGADTVDAGMYLDMLGDLAVCQIVNPMKTVRLELPRLVTEAEGFTGFAQEDGL